jgi:ABC-2 type transport system permease protein
MAAFLEIIRMHFKVFIQYKWTFVLTLIIHPVILLINVALFTSIYAYNQTQFIKGYSLDQMIWYFTAVSFISIFVWNFTDQRISNRILTGELTIDLLRPVSLFRFELANAIALRITGIFFEFVPGIILYSLLYFPRFLTVAAFVKFFILAVTAFFIYYLFSFLLGLSAFIIKSNTAIIDIRVAIMSIIGGSVIPLEFYPGWLNAILDFLPFKYIFYWPVQFFLNKEAVRGLDKFILIFLIQWLWILIFYWVCKFLWKKAVKKFCAVGG